MNLILLSPSAKQSKKKNSQKTWWQEMLFKTRKYFKKKRKNGFTMIELLVVIVIVGLASTAGVVGFQASQQKSRDATRKGDLQKIKVAFEDYYNDNNCYPPSTALDLCGGTSLAPYLPTIPCDPMTQTPYLYVPLASACSGYRVHAALENESDPAIAGNECDTEQGCGYGEEYNYGIAAGTTVFDPDGEPIVQPSPVSSPITTSSPVPSPSSSEPIYVYACDSAGTCNQFEEGHPALVNCPVTFPQSNCNAECGNPALRCSF
jgi:prepilin-type N-terminal cleavage/methylation domain-containing protein